MYTVTFYSYRGGVGRTTALVNVGVDLSLRNRKVVLVDFDLEAPSLSSFGPLRPNDAHPGLVEFIDEYLRSGKAPEIADYIYKARHIDENCGEIWVMPAGRGDDDYWRAFHAIDWKELYDLKDGFLLFEDIRYQLRELLHPDYILVDARAGINDRLAVCTRQLPDAVVMLFTPDSAGDAGDGDRAGFHRVMRDVVAASVDTGPRRIDLLLVASKVPDLDGEHLGLESRLQPDYLIEPDEDPSEIYFGLAATIPQAPELLVDRQIIVAAGSPPRKRLPRAYRRLANCLIKSNCTGDRVGARAFLKEHRHDRGAAVGGTLVDLAGRWYDCTARLNQIIERFDRDAQILAQAAACFFVAGEHDRAMHTLDRAIEVNPQADSIRWQRASYRRQLMLAGEADDLLQLLDAPESTEMATKVRGSAVFADDSPGINGYVRAAFRRLRRLGKVNEALQKARVRQLSHESLNALIKDIPIVPASAVMDPRSLIELRRWPRAIALLKARIAESDSARPRDLFFLAMAYWGSGNEARAAEACRSARMLMLEGSRPDELLQALDADDIEELPMWSLVFWKAGDKNTAQRFLDRSDELLPTIAAKEFDSLWRFRLVDRDQFTRDLHSQRMMMQGVSVRPPFLRKKPGRT